MDPEIVALIVVFTIFRFPAVANKPRGQLKNTPHYIVLYTNHAGSAFIKFANPPRRGPAPRGIFFLGPPRLAASIGAGISRSGLFPGKVGVPRLGSPEGGEPPCGGGGRGGGHNSRSVLPCRSGPAPQIRAEFPLSSALSIRPGATNPGRISAQFRGARPEFLECISGVPWLCVARRKTFRCTIPELRVDCPGDARASRACGKPSGLVTRNLRDGAPDNFPAHFAFPRAP